MSAPRIMLRLAALVAAQGAHSIEEYFGRLWEVMPPARFVANLVSLDPARGFVIFNVSLFAFGAWCVFWPVRRGWPSGRAFAWGWVIVETSNFVVHTAWSLVAGQYRPGVVTAPLLLLFALLLARELRRASR